MPYDWRNTADLETVLVEARAKNAVVICSSEGGLFEYGVDADIEANLKALRASAIVLAVVGSVTRADAPMQKLRRMIERPFSDQVVLT